jgi:outer membrane protein assembly factor BamD (BamD/ComL family)
MPYSAVPLAQSALNDYDGFSDNEREQIGWKNAFALFPRLVDKFPEMKK